MHKLTLLLLMLALFSCNKRPRRNIAFYLNLGGEPTTLNPITATDAYSSSVHAYILEPLLTRNIDTYEWEPALAEKWEVSQDKMTFTFYMKKDLKWHDGMPVTAHDVKFSYDVIYDDNYNTAHRRPYYEGLKEVKVIDDHTVQFVAKDKYWKNFDVAAGMLSIIPKHYYEKGLKKSVYNKTLIGTGPYKLALYKRGSRIVLEKNEDWWGHKRPNNKEYTFKKIVLRFVQDPNVSLEMLKKGSFDFISLRPNVYIKNTSGKEWGKSVHKVKTYNNSPKGYTFIGWNLQDPILKDKKVRKALYHLINRDLMIDKFEYKLAQKAFGPVYPKSPYALKKPPIVEFDPKKALKLLREAGWKDVDGDNILDKTIDGKKYRLSLTILEPYPPYVKYLTVFKEDAKKAGVDINIKQIEWNSFIKLLDERKFQAVRLAWSAAVDWEPMQIWHSKSIKGGSNFIGYSNKEVDRLIEKAKYVHDRAERIKVLDKVQRKIIDDAPYAFMITKDVTLYGHTERIEKERETMNYGVGTAYWTFKSEMRKQ
jgi:ABC-type transport system substrate-binding protein